MYSKEEAKAIREEFWERFRSLSQVRRTRKGLPGNWMLNNTGVKALNLRFHVDRTCAQVGIDLETRNMDKRLELYEKLESVQKILEGAMGTPMIWEIDYVRENGKAVSRVYLQLDNIDIYDQGTWNRAHDFMYSHMLKLEDFYREYRDFFKYG